MTKRKFFNKVLLILLLSAYIPFFIVAFYFIYNYNKIIIATASENLRNGVSILTEDIQNFIKDNTAEVGFEADLVSSMRLLTMEKQTLTFSEKQRMQVLLDNFLRRKFQIFIESYLILNKNGIVVFDSSGAMNGNNLSNHDSFKKTMRSGLNHFIMIPVPDSEGGGCYFGSPLKDLNNNILGVFIIRYKLNVLQNIVSRRTDLTSRKTFGLIMHDDGMCIANGLDYKMLFKKIPLLDNLDSYDRSIVHILPAGVFGKESYYYMFDYVYSSEWMLFFMQSKSVYDKQIRNKIDILIFITVILVFVIIIMALVFGYFITLPLKDLTETSRKIASGDTSARCKVRSSDEIGSFANTFNIMADEIDSFTKNMYSKNEELNNEIEIRIRTEAELKRIQSLFMTIIDSMPSLLMFVDKSGIVTLWNNEASKRTGIVQSEAAGRSIDELLPEFKGEMGVIREVIANNSPYNRHNIEHKIGTKTFFFDLTIYPIVTDWIKGAVIRVDDVTERHNMEELMLRSQNMISISWLAAGMAHEINNPLSIISQAAQNLKRKLDVNDRMNVDAAAAIGIDIRDINRYANDRKITDYVEYINSGAMRSAKILSKLIEFTNLRELSKKNACIHEIIEGILNDIRAEFTESGNIQIIYKEESEIPEMAVSIDELKNALTNVIRNGIQAIEDLGEPGGVIKIKSYKQHDFAIIEISDNGVGINKGIQNSIFEPFFTTRQVGSGTGLGLTIAYFIITKTHNGSIDFLENPDGRGTTFVIKLPITAP